MPDNTDLIQRWSEDFIKFIEKQAADKQEMLERIGKLEQKFEVFKIEMRTELKYKSIRWNVISNLVTISTLLLIAYLTGLIK